MTVRDLNDMEPTWQQATGFTHKPKDGKPTKRSGNTKASEVAPEVTKIVTKLQQQAKDEVAGNEEDED